MCILIKKIFDDDKKFYLLDRFFVLNQNFSLEHVKNSAFFMPKLSKYRFFKFSRFQGKVATLKKFNLYF